MKVLRVRQDDGTTEPLSDVLKEVKFSSLAWTHDNKGATPTSDLLPALWCLALQVLASSVQLKANPRFGVMMYTHISHTIMYDNAHT